MQGEIAGKFAHFVLFPAGGLAHDAGLLLPPDDSARFPAHGPAWAVVDPRGIRLVRPAQ